MEMMEDNILIDTNILFFQLKKVSFLTIQLILNDILFKKFNAITLASYTSP